MNYSIEFLEKEKQLLKSCLSDWDCKNYPDAKKERQKKLEDLEECITILKMVQDGINPFSTHNVYGIDLNKKTLSKNEIDSLLDQAEQNDNDYLLDNYKQ